MGSERFRDKEIRIRVSEEELEFAKQKAKYLNMKLSEMIRKLIVDNNIVVCDTVNIQELSYEINKIGTNINQIAKHVNEKGGQYDRQDIDSLILEFENLQAKIYAKIYGLEE